MIKLRVWAKLLETTSSAGLETVALVCQSVIETVGDQLVSRNKFIDLHLEHLVFFMCDSYTLFQLLNLCYKDKTGIIELVVGLLFRVDRLLQLLQL